jgi:general secretion pathway protein D
MRHRWSSAFTNPIPLIACALLRARKGLLGHIRIHGSGQVDDVKRGTASLLCGIVHRDQHGKRISFLIDPRESGSVKLHGSLMNRLAIPLKVCRNVIAVGLSVALVCGTVPGPVFAKESAKKLFVLGQKAEAREDYDAAYEAYRKAYAVAPNDLRMRAAYYRLRQSASSMHVTLGRKLYEKGDEQGALTEFLRSAEIDPGNEAAIQEVAKIRAKQSGLPIRSETSLSEPATEEIEDAGAPARLKPVSNEPLTLHMTEDSKVVYQAVGKAAGINVLFDPDYNGKRIQVDLTNVSLMDALRIVGTLSNTFWRPVTDNTIFVAQNNRSKHTELDEQAVQTFYLSNAWQQNDLNDVQTALRNVMANAKVYGVPSQNAIVIRATPDELTLAQKIINDLDKARPEVVVDVAIMEVDKDKLRNIGLTWPGSISFALQPPTTSTSTTTTTTTTTNTTGGTTAGLTLDNLANLNANSFGITVGAATANLLMTDSNSRILQNPRIRSTDGQKSTMKIGERIPIATGSYQTGATTAITSSLVNTQFQYIDVGVNIEMTPTVHFDHDITLKLKIEDSSEASNVTISGVTEPIIAQKTSEQTIRLREGEASILGGILQKQDLVSISAIPGIGELPLLKYVFGSKQHEVIDDEIVFVLIPHIVRGQELSPLNLRRIDTGAGQTIELRHLDDGAPRPGQAPGAGGIASNAAAQQTPGMRPSHSVSNVAPLKGQTAEVAASSAMTQLRQQNASDVPTMSESSAPAKAGAGAPASSSPIGFNLVPPAASPAVGTNFQVPVILNGGKDVASVPLQIQYDASKLTLINVDSGELLGKDGQAVALVHRDDGPGLITIAASRPPGAAGISGSGSVCMLTFQAKQAGQSDLVIVRPGALDSTQHPIAASAQNAHIVIH